MFHRHLTLEQLELEREEQPGRAARLEQRAARCAQCSAIIAEGSRLGESLAAWSVPPVISRPADWHLALTRAIAPTTNSRIAAAPRTSGTRLGAVVLASLALMVLAAAPAAAAAGPDSILYPVRGIEENARWSVTPGPDRPRLEADLASSYLWQARVSAGRHDDAGYHASMDRFFVWGERLKGDLRRSPTNERPAIKATVTAAQSLLPDLHASGQNQQENDRAQQVLNDVQSQEGDGDHQGNN